MNNQKKERNWMPWILLVVLIGTIILQFISSNTNEKIDRLRKENEKLEILFQKEKVKADSLVSSGDMKAREADSALLELNQNIEKYNLKLQENEDLKRTFRNLPVATRDSLILDYIRANQ